jgi:hypothetical protein
MPTSDRILAGLTEIALAASPLAIVWHLALAVAIVALLAGWRPSRRSAGILIATPLISAGVVAAVFGNPVNASAMGVGGIALIALAARLPAEPVEAGPAWSAAAGWALVAFGWGYPHFLPPGSSFEYLSAAPTGLIPCPSLSVAIGFALLAGGLGRAWSRVLGALGLLYGLFGALRLGVRIDLFLVLGAVALLALLKAKDRNMKLITLTSLIVLLVSQAGCAHREVAYEQEASPPTPGVPTYRLPPQDPKGTVYVVSLGGEQLASAPGGMAPYLHLRIAAENLSDGSPWTLEAGDQTVSVAGAPGQRPSFAQASSGGPTLILSAGQRGELDLFYPMPSSGTAPLVTLSWKVRRGAELSMEATSFARVASEPPRGPYAYVYHPVWRPGLYFDYGFGWWWGPQVAFGWHVRPWYFAWHPRFHRPYNPPRRVYVPPAKR